MSLAPKIDELREVSKQIDVDLFCITESWLQNHIHDNVVEISGYNIVRRHDAIDIKANTVASVSTLKML